MGTVPVQVALADDLCLEINRGNCTLLNLLGLSVTVDTIGHTLLVSITARPVFVGGSVHSWPGNSREM